MFLRKNVILVCWILLFYLFVTLYSLFYFTSDLRKIFLLFHKAVMQSDNCCVAVFQNTRMFLLLLIIFHIFPISVSSFSDIFSFPVTGDTPSEYLRIIIFPLCILIPFFVFMRFYVFSPATLMVQSPNFHRSFKVQRKIR